MKLHMQHTDWVRDFLNHLDVCNSMASERWHQSMLKEQADFTAGPFSIICERHEMVIQSFTISRSGKKLSSSRKESEEPSAKSISLQSLQRLCKKSYIQTHKTLNQTEKHTTK